MKTSTKEKLEGNWNQFKGRIKQTWGSLTDDEMKQAEGRADKLVGVIEEKTGEAREAVEERLTELVQDTPSPTASSSGRR